VVWCESRTLSQKTLVSFTDFTKDSNVNPTEVSKKGGFRDTPKVQSAAGQADPSTTKLYDRRGYNPEKSASFFANY